MTINQHTPRHALPYRTVSKLGATIAVAVLAATASAGSASASPARDSSHAAAVTVDRLAGVSCFNTPHHWNSSLDGPIPTCIVRVS